MKLIKHVAVIVVACLLLGCGGDAVPKYHGFLYFGAGSYLGKFSLRDGSSSIVSSVGNANIREVDQLHGSRLLLSLDAIENNREVAKITWLDVRTLQDTALFAGVAAVWVPDVQTYIYDDGSRLSAASTHRDYVTDNVIMDHRINDLAEILVVSPTSIVFQIGFRERRRIWQYDVDSASTAELEPLANVCSLRHSAWISVRRQLACKTQSSGDYVLVGLDGQVAAMLALPEGREFEALEYVPDQDLLIFSEPWRSAVMEEPRTAVWAYDFDSGDTHRISEHQYLGNSTVYRRE